MPDSLSFEELLKSLPEGGFAGKEQPAFRLYPPGQVFVPPTLRVVASTEEPKVTLISARGATGKTMLARALSSDRAVPLWALNDDQGVSADALEARLARYIGPEDPLERFRADPAALVVIDALDEARMRVSATSWGEFVASLCGVSTAGHHFVLFGRDRLLEELWVDLDDAAVTPRWLEISHFDPEQRIAYVDSFTKATRDTSSSIYQRARDAVLASLAGTMETELSEAFVGYAPVLDAVVALLKNKNLASVESDFKPNGGGHRSVDVLAQVLERLLERDRTKTDPLAQSLGLDENSVYTPDEQIDWLASELMGADAPALSHIPDQVRGEYVEKVFEFMRDHPFRSEQRWASPVFSAFVAARKFGDITIREKLRSVADTTGLLFEFVCLAEDSLVLDEPQFAALHASLLAGEWQQVEANVSIGSADPATVDPAVEYGDAEGEFMLLEGHEIQRRKSFTLILNQASRLLVSGPTASLSVVFPGDVVCRARSASIVLGPDCHIRCVNLTLEGETIEVARRSDLAQRRLANEAIVVLEVFGSFVSSGNLIGSPSASSFELRVKPAHRLVYPWVTYRIPLDERTELEPDERAMRFLNKFVSLLRNHGRSTMGVLDKNLEGRQGLKGEQFRAALRVLEAHGVIHDARSAMITLRPQWESHLFDGKGRAGMAQYEDQREAWDPVLADISQAIR